MAEECKTSCIRALNDTLRCRHVGGRIVFTRGIFALGSETLARMLAAIANFHAFSPDNDPYGEHDCAAMTVLGQRIIWKIDYYDRDFEIASPDPSNPEVTLRVLTVMLAEEY